MFKFFLTFSVHVMQFDGISTSSKYLPGKEAAINPAMHGVPFTNEIKPEHSIDYFNVRLKEFIIFIALIFLQPICYMNPGLIPVQQCNWPIYQVSFHNYLSKVMHCLKGFLFHYETKGLVEFLLVK